MQYERVTATNKLLELRKRIRGIAGGTSASKTVSILIILIDYAQRTDKKVISIVSESMPHLRKGAMRDFLNILQSQNYFRDDKWNKTDSVYTFETWKDKDGTIHGGSIIEFFGVESWERVKGARRDVLFINEANHIDYNSYTQLEIRTREVIWLDWNPENEFWWYTDVMPNRDVDFITLTYKDNEACPIEIVQTIEARKGDLNWWKVYGLGQLGDVEGRIYTKWQIIKEIPPEARLQRYGIDLGYSNDPTAIIAIYYYNGGYILDELLYQMGLKNREIAEFLKIQTPAIAICDSAEPKSIDEIKDYGFKQIYPSTKGQGSVLQGIQYVQSQAISVTNRSVNLLKEYRNYLWETDKEGKIINEPQEFMNHCMDAIRYGLDKFQRSGISRQNIEVGGVKPYIEGTLA